MKTVVEDFLKSGFVELQPESPAKLKSFNSLKETFNGYDKVISTVLMSYFELPIWPTFLLKDLTEKNLSALSRFVKKSEFFFIRTDAYNNFIDNVACKVCPRDLVITKVKEFKRVDKRFVLVLATPNIPNQAYKNLANCRTGIINAKEIQEWVGPGFSEYHLGKDKFPHTTKLHAYIEFKNQSQWEFKYLVDDETYFKDVEQLVWAYGLEQMGLKEKFFEKNYFKSLTGKVYKGEEPTNDEQLEAFNAWRLQKSKEQNTTEEKKDMQITEKGREFLESFEGSTLLSYGMKTKKAWCPDKDQVDEVHKSYVIFKQKCKLIGLDPKEKILTLSLNKGVTKSNMVCWDIFNLL
jgi:hypothetical protein